MSFVMFSIVEVLNTIKSLKNGKATGLDNLYGEHFKCPHDKVAVLLATRNLMFPQSHFVHRMWQLLCIPSRVVVTNNDVSWSSFYLRALGQSPNIEDKARSYFRWDGPPKDEQS